MGNITTPQRQKTEGQSFWDANPCGGTWASYADFMAWIQCTESYGFEIVNQCDWTGKRVLDVGCGQGAKLNYLPRFGATMFGVDMSSESLRRAAAGVDELGHSDQVHISVADAERLPYPDACFDAVLSFGVLHHTPDTCGGVKELWRVLKPGGLALVMLYRTGNPKWWMTRLVRRASHLVDLISGKPYTIANWLRPHHEGDDVRGTALLELFGCPVLKAFSNQQVREIFRMFSRVSISNHQPGFRRMVDVVPLVQPLESFLVWFDRQVTPVWGFYQVIEARK
jgi:SAM-dependent methyltransferase